jgi:uncharacterized protein (DUF1330 family)
MEEVMRTQYTVALSMLAGVALGAVSVGGLYAQGKAPGAYAIIDISDVSNPDGFKQLFPKAPPAVAAFDGHFVTRTEKITALDGTPPKRFVIIGFDSVDKAKAWDASAAQKEVNEVLGQERTQLRAQWHSAMEMGDRARAGLASFMKQEGAAAPHTFPVAAAVLPFRPHAEGVRPPSAAGRTR